MRLNHFPAFLAHAHLHRIAGDKRSVSLCLDKSFMPRSCAVQKQPNNNIEFSRLKAVQLRSTDFVDLQSWCVSCLAKAVIFIDGFHECNPFILPGCAVLQGSMIYNGSMHKRKQRKTKWSQNGSVLRLQFFRSAREYHAFLQDILLLLLSLLLRQLYATEIKHCGAELWHDDALDMLDRQSPPDQMIKSLAKTGWCGSVACLVPNHCLCNWMWPSPHKVYKGFQQNFWPPSIFYISKHKTSVASWPSNHELARNKQSRGGQAGPIHASIKNLESFHRSQQQRHDVRSHLDGLLSSYSQANLGSSASKKRHFPQSHLRLKTLIDWYLHERILGDWQIPWNLGWSQ